MTKKTTKTLPSKQAATESSDPGAALTQPAQKKVSYSSLNATEKNREISKVKSAETAAQENHYVNGSFTHSTSNRGK